MKAEPITRVSISIPAKLLERFDAMTRGRGYVNRSLAMADMIRDALVEEEARGADEEIAGTITLVYDHHKPHLQDELTELQHRHLSEIVSTLHVHLDHQNCLEVLIVRGKACSIREVADRLISAKGVKHGKLTVTTTGRDLPA